MALQTLNRQWLELEVLHGDLSDILYYKVTYSYMEFDAQGNWTKRLESETRQN